MAGRPDLQHVIIGRLVGELVVTYPICVVQTNFTARDQGFKCFMRLQPSGGDEVFLQDLIRAELAF